ncbi:MBL fold metallo-hydrolase [Loktanella sp. M215]|uniref:MBL fold metallo-hydrolase n=1 Tax=Loktanella sp. M215 TaxID=2675431 RepID=UPI001F242912|nr:MBL fold metallo-hydrolase [Loktanella sp. M215]MCF7698925.1 MBL fold metallo-hydrolase [Loktanella sp. M215]
MKLTRRTAISGMIALAGGTILPRLAWANATLTVGSGTLDTLSDGHLVLPRDFVLADIPKADADAVLADFGLADADTLLPDCNLTLWRDGDRVVLFDAGSGPDFMPTAGHVMAAMDALGLAPEDVTDIVFTHGHPDHLWGVLDDFDEPLFANAQHHMGQIEFDYWTDPGLPDTILPERLIFAVGAARRLEVLADTINLFADGAEIIPGVTARATFGHTPGHMSFEVAAGDEMIVVLGDCIANHHIAFARPDWPNGSDQDTATAVATRTALLEQLADADTVFAGFHLPTPGIGRAKRLGETYEFVALA